MNIFNYTNALRRCYIIFAISFLATSGISQAAIQYSNFGPATINTSNPEVNVNFFGANLSFIWAQLSTTREGQVIWDRDELTGNTMGVSLMATTVPASPAINLSSGATIGATNSWRSSLESPLTAQPIYRYNMNTTAFNANFLNPSRVGYLGMRFQYNGGNYYYGWLEIISISSDGSSYQLGGFAYNDTPNASITAGQTSDPVPPPSSSAIPEPASVGMMVLGAAGIYALRRRDD